LFFLLTTFGPGNEKSQRSVIVHRKQSELYFKKIRYLLSINPLAIDLNHRGNNN
jgi:hypothetical protein